jgi:hypothetical protein
LFPLRLSNQDGHQIQVVARAVDEAGNVSPETAPLTITLDRIGPTVTAWQDGALLLGSAYDGSGVAKIEVSIDGGRSYEPVQYDGTGWTLDMTEWEGSLPQVLALIRAEDNWGNISITSLALDTSQIPWTGPILYMPLTQRR